MVTLVDRKFPCEQVLTRSWTIYQLLMGQVLLMFAILVHDRYRRWSARKTMPMANDDLLRLIAVAKHTENA